MNEVLKVSVIAHGKMFCSKTHFQFAHFYYVNNRMSKSCILHVQLEKFVVKFARQDSETLPKLGEYFAVIEVKEAVEAYDYTITIEPVSRDFGDKRIGNAKKT